MENDLYDYGEHQGLDNSLNSLIKLVENNMKAIQYETENLYSSEINKDQYSFKSSPYDTNTYWKNHYWDDNKNFSYRQREPIDVWMEKQTDMANWDEKPALDIANWQEKPAKDIANWQERPRDEVKWLERPKEISYWRNQPKDIASWQDALERNHERTYGVWGDYFRQINPPKKDNNPKRVQFTNHHNGIVVPDNYRNFFEPREKENEISTKKPVIFGDELDSNWIRKFRLDSVEKCHRCQKDIFPSELIRLADKTWHKWCIKCKQCWLTLDDPNNIKKFSGEIYCNRCHNNVLTSSFYQLSPEMAPYYRSGFKVEPDDNKLKNALARKYYNGRYHMFDRKPVYDEFGLWNNTYQYPYEHIYENQDAILINSYRNPSKPKKPLRGILKRFKPLPPNPPEYLLLHKQFMHPLSRRYLEEIERKSIKYDNTVDDRKHLLENDRITINLNKKEPHQSAEEGNGFQTVYETILKSARDTWIDEYGVPVRNKKHMFENWIENKNRSSFVDKEYRLPNYYEQRSANVIRHEAVPLRSVSRIKQDFYNNINNQKVDERKTHSLRRGDVTNKIVEIENMNLTSNDVEKDAWRYDMKSYEENQNIPRGEDIQIYQTRTQSPGSENQPRLVKSLEDAENEIKHKNPVDKANNVESKNELKTSSKPQTGEKVYVPSEDGKRMQRPSSLKTKSSAKTDKSDKKVSFTGEPAPANGPAVVEFRLSKDNRFYLDKLENDREDAKQASFKCVGDFKEKKEQADEEPKTTGKDIPNETLSPGRRAYSSTDRKFEQRGSKAQVREQEDTPKTVEIDDIKSSEPQSPLHHPQEVKQVEEEKEEPVEKIEKVETVETVVEVEKVESKEEGADNATHNNVIPPLVHNQMHTIEVPDFHTVTERKGSDVSDISQEKPQPKIDLASTFQPYQRASFTDLVDTGNNNMRGMKKKKPKSKGFFRKISRTLKTAVIEVPC